jgi:hypothetical protein
MEKHTEVLMGIAVIVIAVLVSSPVLAHEKYRRHPAGHYPLRIQIQHSHDLGEPAAIVTPESEGFNPFRIAYDIASGAWEFVDNTVGSIFRCKATSVAQSQDYRFTVKDPSGSGKWKQIRD